MDSFSETLLDEINLIPEGSQSLLTMKSEGTIVETDRIWPSITIIRGQKSSVIVQTGWEIWDCDFVIKIENCNGY
jgi:hypothetical protein